MNLSIVKFLSIMVWTPVAYPSFWQNLSAPFLLSEKLWAQIGDHKRFQNIIGEPSLSNFTSPFWHAEGALISGNSELRCQKIREYKLLKLASKSLIDSFVRFRLVTFDTYRRRYWWNYRSHIRHLPSNSNHYNNNLDNTPHILSYTVWLQYLCNQGQTMKIIILSRIFIC